MSKKKIFIKTHVHGGSTYIEPIEEFPNMLGGDIENAKVGDAFTLTILEMTQEEYDALPEFEGH